MPSARPRGVPFACCSSDRSSVRVFTPLPPPRAPPACPRGLGVAVPAPRPGARVAGNSRGGWASAGRLRAPRHRRAPSPAAGSRPAPQRAALAPQKPPGRLGPHPSLARIRIPEAAFPKVPKRGAEQWEPRRVSAPPDHFHHPGHPARRAQSRARENSRHSWPGSTSRTQWSVAALLSFTQLFYQPNSGRCSFPSTLQCKSVCRTTIKHGGPLKSLGNQGWRASLTKPITHRLLTWPANVVSSLAAINRFRCCE